ncbi:hypothetical protein C8R45DRAFT_1083098 [Mycena sanguinolenta]|nr:hypothetical protein C8R45DRAFT_1083098 [Mycena sanguinolenta]
MSILASDVTVPFTFRLLRRINFVQAATSLAGRPASLFSSTHGWLFDAFKPRDIMTPMNSSKTPMLRSLSGTHISIFAFSSSFRNILFRAGPGKKYPEFDPSALSVDDYELAASTPERRVRYRLAAGSVTHLELMSASANVDMVWRNMANIPNLTHLALNPDLSAQLSHHDLAGDVRLQCILFLSLGNASLDGSPLWNDSRFVYIEETVDYDLNWGRGAVLGDDNWALADAFIAARRAGKIDRLYLKLFEITALRAPVVIGYDYACSRIDIHSAEQIIRPETRFNISDLGLGDFP